jgi:hypothetical protein
MLYFQGEKNLLIAAFCPGNFDPTQSRINFSVPFAKVKSTSESPVPPSQVKPGILTHLLDKFAMKHFIPYTPKFVYNRVFISHGSCIPKVEPFDHIQKQ